MSVIPTKDLEAVQFFETHNPVWGTAPTTIGLTAAQVTAQDGVTKLARNAYLAQQSAKVAAKNATQAFHDAVTKMRTSGSDLVATIKAFAATTNNPAVYTTAQIPPPSAPTPAPAPGQPGSIAVSLEPSGAVTLKWKATNAAAGAGTFFTIKRKLASDANFTLIGTTGAKSYTDSSLTFGTNTATYLIQGQRGTLAGPESEQISVQFGIGGGGAGFAVGNGELKMAA